MNTLAPNSPPNQVGSSPSHAGRPTFNLELRGYEMALREWLQKAKHFHQFKSRISEELQRMGFSDWTYSRLDIPPSLSIKHTVGTLSQDQLVSFLGGNHYIHDFVYHHIKANKRPVYGTFINTILANLAIETDIEDQQNKGADQHQSKHYSDYLFVPLHTNNQDNHAVFSLAAKNVNSTTLQEIVTTHSDNIRILIKLIEEVGIEKYSAYFSGAKNTFYKLQNARPMRLLKLMGEKDFDIYQAAEALHISRTAADKQLAKIRDHMGVHTNHGALIEAIKQGYISPKS